MTRIHKAFKTARLVGLCITLQFVFVFKSYASTEVHSGRLYDFCIESSTQSLTISLELAVTSAQRARGLMNRTEVLPNHGMLFVYERPRKLGFWMLNTLIPLDIAYINAENEIVQIGQMQPCESNHCPAYESEFEVTKALEMAAGEFERLGVEIGTVLQGGHCDG